LEEIANLSHRYVNNIIYRYHSFSVELLSPF
jgi:hypothetical protein